MQAEMQARSGAARIKNPFLLAYRSSVRRTQAISLRNRSRAMTNRTEQFNDGPKADGADGRSRHPDPLGEVPRVRLSGNPVVFEGGHEQKQQLRKRLRLNSTQLDAL